MSRSYKKNPIVTDSSSTTKERKRLANKIFRNKIAIDEDMSLHPQYKKYSESFDIRDYKSRMTYGEAIDWYMYRINHDKGGYFKKQYPTLESWLKYWEKCYKRK